MISILWVAMPCLDGVLFLNFELNDTALSFIILPSLPIPWIVKSGTIFCGMYIGTLDRRLY